MATRQLLSLSKRNCDGIAFRKRQESSAISGMRSFRHDLPAIAQHARDVVIHCLHARQQPLPVVFPRPISLVRKRLHFHPATPQRLFLAPFLQETRLDRVSEGTKSLSIVGEQIAKRKQMSVKGPEARKLRPGPS